MEGLPAILALLFAAASTAGLEVLFNRASARRKQARTKELESRLEAVDSDSERIKSSLEISAADSREFVEWLWKSYPRIRPTFEDENADAQFAPHTDSNADGAKIDVQYDVASDAQIAAKVWRSLAREAEPGFRDEQTPSALAKYLEQVSKGAPPVEKATSPAEFTEFWRTTYRRLETYHSDSRSQLASSYRLAQFSALAGFMVLLVAAFSLAFIDTTAQAVAAGTVGAIGSALAAYIARTFNETYKRTLAQSNAYFQEPVVMARLLAAERLLEEFDFDSPERDKALHTMVKAAVGFNGNVKMVPEPLGQAESVE